MLCFEKGFRSFNTSNMGSVGQRTLKLLGVKVGVLKKKSAPLAISAELRASLFSPSLSWPRVESFSKFDGQQICRPIDLIFHVLKDQNPF